MDDKSLEIMVKALAGRVQETFITKVHQMTPYHLLLRLRGGGAGGELRLLISTAPQEPGLHLTARRYLNPPRPLRFCAYLRHHLQGARIRTIEKVKNDRVVIIRAARREQEELQLIIELIGKRGNVVLSRGEEMLIGALMLEKNGPERLKTGTPYCFPETGKISTDKPYSPILLKTIDLPETIDIKNCSELQISELQSCYDDWFFPLYQKHYGNLEIRNLEKSLKQHQRRLKKRVKKLQAEKSDKTRHLNDNRIGDLIKGEIHKIKRGTKKVSLTNYYSDTLEKVEVTLNPAISPLANLEKFYKNAKKAKRGIKLIEERLSVTEREENYTAELIYQLAELSSHPDRPVADEEQEILEIAAKLTEKRGHQKQEKSTTGKTKGKLKPKSKPVQQNSSAYKQRGVTKKTGVNGGTIYVGLNVIGNENIYRHLSTANDLWFHARNCPGAHILLKTAPGSEECENEQQQAAALAAENSKLNTEKIIEVTMIRVKYLRKPKGGRPGQLLLNGPIQTLQVKNND